MRGSRNSAIIVAVVLIAILLGAIEYFLLVSPRLSAASEARIATEEQTATNANLQVTLKKRKADNEKLPETRAEIWAIRDQFPPLVDEVAFRRLLDEIAVKHGFISQSDSLGGAVVVEPSISLAEALAQVGKEPYADGLKFTGLSAVPFSLTIQGNYKEIFSYLDDLQVGEHRYLLISSATITPLGVDDGRIIPSSVDDVELIINGAFFVLDYEVPGISVSPTQPPEDETPPPNTNRNPFVPPK